MRWIPLTLLLLIASNAQALEYKTINGGVLSTTLFESISIDEARFINTVVLHFIGAKDCWKQKVIPRQKTIDKITVCTIIVCRKFWPQQPEKMYQFFSLIISESGGNNVGNPDDPSYGVCHATMASAHNACQVWGIPHPRSTKYCDARCTGLAYRSDISFKNLLEEDLMFNVTCGAGEAAITDIKAGHDWVRALLMYKFGERGFLNAMSRLGDRPITEIQSKNGQYIWKNYNRLYSWVNCLSDRSGIAPITRCGCLPPEPRE